MTYSVLVATKDLNAAPLNDYYDKLGPSLQVYTLFETKFELPFIFSFEIEKKFYNVKDGTEDSLNDDYEFIFNMMKQLKESLSELDTFDEIFIKENELLKEMVLTIVEYCCDNPETEMTYLGYSLPENISDLLFDYGSNNLKLKSDIELIEGKVSMPLNVFEVSNLNIIDSEDIFNIIINTYSSDIVIFNENTQTKILNIKDLTYHQFSELSGEEDCLGIYIIERELNEFSIFNVIKEMKLINVNT